MIEGGMRLIHEKRGWTQEEYVGIAPLVAQNYWLIACVTYLYSVNDSRSDEVEPPKFELDDANDMFLNEFTV